MANNYLVIEHPVAQHKLGLLRDKSTDPKQFRRIMEELSQLMAYEVTRDAKTKLVDVETPMAKTKCPRIDEDLVLVSIMRAGNGMLEGMMKLLSYASVGHVGIYRDKFIKNTVEYYFRLPPDVEGKKVLLLDPMLATADTAVAAIGRLKEYNVGPIVLVNILSSKFGLERIEKTFPDVKVVTFSIEPDLNESGYLIPGMGDAGDRLYGTTV